MRGRAVASRGPQAPGPPDARRSRKHERCLSSSGSRSARCGWATSGRAATGGSSAAEVEAAADGAAAAAQAPAPARRGSRRPSGRRASVISAARGPEVQPGEPAARRAEVRAGDEGHAPALQERRGRVVAQAERAAVQPREEARLGRPVADRGAAAPRAARPSRRRFASSRPRRSSSQASPCSNAAWRADHAEHPGAVAQLVGQPRGELRPRPSSEPAIAIAHFSPARLNAFDADVSTTAARVAERAPAACGARPAASAARGSRRPRRARRAGRRARPRPPGDRGASTRPVGLCGLQSSSAARAAGERAGRSRRGRARRRRAEPRRPCSPASAMPGKNGG